LSAKTWMRKTLTLPLMVLAAGLILFEDFVWNKITLLVGLVSRWRLVARLERWVLTRDRTTTLALFAIPISALIPIKLIAVYLIVSGHVTLGILVIIAAKLIGTAISARLFMIAKPKLMTFETFVLVYNKVIQFKNWAHRIVNSLGVREALARAKAAVQTTCLKWAGPSRWAKMRGSTLGDRLLAARRHLRKPPCPPPMEP
jgi:hypothetical protein